MRFSTVALFGALAALASAQNPFTRTSYDGISAGQPEDITWDATSKGTVTLVLMQGNPKALKPVQVIASSIVNDGKYTWTPDPTLVSSNDYALKIVDDANPNAPPNYSTLFSIDTAVTESSSSASLSASATETTTLASTTETLTTSATTSEATSSESSTASSSETTSATSTDVVTSTSTNTETTTTSSETSSAESTTTMESSTRRSSTRASSSATPSSTIVEGAAATGSARIGAGLVGFVGAALLLL